MPKTARDLAREIGLEAAGLPPDWGKIDGEDHPDTVIANANWNAAVEACLKLLAKWFFMANKDAKACRDEMRALLKN